MKSTTSTYKQIIASGDSRNWLVTINMTLTDGTELTLTEENIMMGTFKILSASSSDSSFDIGSAVIGKCAFALDNWTDEYTEYDFFNAEATIWVKLVGDSQYTRMGFFTVDEPTYAGSMVQLELLDSMWKFDKPFSDVDLLLPASILQIISAICLECGVTLHSQTFHGYDFVINDLPEQEMNCREVLQYLAMIGCNFCVMTTQGALDLRWYGTYTEEESLDGGTFNTDTTPYSDGDSADGGNFTDYTSGDSFDGGSFSGISDISYFTRLMSRNIGTDIIEITGVKFTVEETSYLIGEEGYVLALENPFVTADNVDDVLNSIWDILEGFKIRPFSVTALPDIAPEVGDPVAVSYKGNMVYSYLTNFTFTPSLCTASLGAISPTRTLSTRYSESVQAAVEIARKNTDQKITNYDLVAQQMNNLAINAIGAYQDYEDLPSGGRVYYLSNMPITKDAQGHCSFEEGSYVFKTTGDGFFVSTDGGHTWVNGYNAQTGELLINVLYTIGLHADWIYTGTLTVGGSNVRTNNPEIVVKDVNNNVVCTINSNGIIMGSGYIASSDYADTSPVSNYSQSGMKIDVNSKYIKSPYFGIDMSGAHLKGEIEATSGHIGVATIDSQAIYVKQDLYLFKMTSTGDYEFRASDYNFYDSSAKLKFKISTAGSNTVAIKKYIDGDYDSLVETVTLNSTEKETTNSLPLSVSGHVVSYKLEYTRNSSYDCEVFVAEATCARIDSEGFHGLLQGMFKGYLESDSGKLAGMPYRNTRANDEAEFEGDFILVKGSNKIKIKRGTNVTPPDVTRTYMDNGVEVTESAFTGAVGNYENQIQWESIAPTTGGSNTDMQFVGGANVVPTATSGDAPSLYYRDNVGWNKLVYASFGTSALTDGVSDLETGKFYFQYE